MRLCCAVGLAIVIASPPARADDTLADAQRDTPVAGHVDEPRVDKQPVAKSVDEHRLAKRVAIMAPVPEDPDDQPAWNYQISTKRRAAAIALAIFPGVVVHGIGAYTVRQKHAAKRLLGGQAIGLGVAALSGLLVGGSGGNPYTLWAIPLVVSGSALFLQSWFTDIFVAAGGEKIVEQPRALAPWSIEVGTSWLHDAYRERALLRGGGRIALGRGDNALGRIELAGTALVDAAGDAQILQSDVRVRILGAPPTGELVDDGSQLTARAGYRFHRDAADRVNQQVGELEVDGRLDLDRIDRAFGRSFVEAGAGFGLVRIRYGEVAHEWSSELLASFAWGAYLGSRGEATVFYEHTRDGLVGGLPAWRAAGFVGSVGATVDVRVYGPWAIRGELDIGNAFLTTLAVSYRGGPQ